MKQKVNKKDFFMILYLGFYLIKQFAMFFKKKYLYQSSNVYLCMLL